MLSQTTAIFQRSGCGSVLLTSDILKERYKAAIEMEYDTKSEKVKDYIKHSSDFRGGDEKTDKLSESLGEKA